MNSQTFTYNQSGTLQENTFTRPGYTFKERKSEKGETFTNGSQIFNLLSS